MKSNYVFVFSLIAAFVLSSPAARAALSGTYTIDAGQPASSTNYQSLASIASDINNGSRTDGGKSNGSGVNGNLTIAFADGLYSQLFAPNIYAPFPYTLTYTSASGDSSKVVFMPSAVLPGNYLSAVTIPANNVILKGITIVIPKNYYYGIDLGYVNQVNMLNCVFISYDNIPTIYAYGSNTSVLIRNCKFINGPNGVKSYANGTFFNIDHCTFLNCTNAISYTPGSGAISITNNKIQCLNGTAVTVNIALPTRPCIIANNMISVNNVSGQAVYGLNIQKTYMLNVYNNNILIYGSYSSNSAAFALIMPVGLKQANYIYNNDFANYCDGLAVQITSNTGSFFAGNNNYFSSGPNIGTWDGASFSSISKWIFYNQTDTNSLSAAPGFSSNTNLHEKNFMLYHAGRPISGINTDYDGDARNSTSPCIGADEFNPVYNDVALGNILGKGASVSCGDSSSPVVLVFNYGTNDLKNVPVVITCINPSISLFDTIPSLKAGSYLRFTFKGKLSTLNGGSYTFLAYTKLNGDVDNNNDTSVLSVFALSSGATPVTSDIYLCNFATGGKIMLTCRKSPKDIADWYDGATYIGSSDSLLYPYDPSTSKIHVVTRRPYEFFAGLKDTSLGFGKFYSFTNTCAVNPVVPVTLDSFTVYPHESGTFKILTQTYYIGNNTIDTFSFQVSPSYPGQPVKLHAGIPIKNVTSLTVTSITTGGLYANLGSAKYLTTNSLLNFTGIDSTFWYLYNCKFTQASCGSDPVNLNVFSNTMNAIIAPDSGFINASTGSFFSNPGTVCSGGTAIYKVSTTFNDADYNTTWKVETLTAITQKGYSNSQITYLAPQNGAPLKIILPSHSLNIKDSVYHLILVIRNLKSGCDSAFSAYVAFLASPYISIISPDTICSGDVANFKTNGHTNNTQWDFGDGHTGSNAIAANQYFNIDTVLKTYLVTLKGTSDNGCPIYDSTRVNVYRFIDPYFSYKDVGNKSFVFSANEKGLMEYYWQFPDGSDNGYTVSHTFKDTGFHAVTLNAKDYHGCGSTFSRTVEVKLPSAISPEFTPNLSVSLYPNPTNSTFTLEYELLHVAQVRTSLADIQGRQIIQLSSKSQQAEGKYKQNFSLPQDLPQGVYILQLWIDGIAYNNRIALIK